MKKITEGDLKFDFSEALSFKKFDDIKHGLSHCMKAVDFILETEHKYYFIEIKDPDNPNAKNRAAFIEKLKTNRLTQGLTGKYRDTFIYRWAEDSLNKPIHYIVLLCIKSLGAEALLTQQENLRRQIPLAGSASWKRPIAQSCTILSLEAWDRHFKQWPIVRISESVA